MFPQTLTRGRKFPAEPLTRDEVRRLLRGIRGGDTGLRNRALVIAMWRGGLRLSEALSLMPSHVDPEHCELAVLRGKGGKRRAQAIDPEAMGAIQAWLDRRAQLSREFPPRTPVFCTRDGRQLSAEYVRLMLRRAARKAGIAKRVHPHGLRHSMTVELIDEGWTLYDVQTQLGHASLDSTAHYVASLRSDVGAKVRQRPNWST
jgi:site-specific recombinase XerD